MMYFYGKVNGVNAEIERHRAEEAKLRSEIEKYQKILENNPDDKMAKRALKVNYHFLDMLLQSKAEVLSKFGKIKELNHEDD